PSFLCCRDGYWRTLPKATLLSFQLFSRLKYPFVAQKEVTIKELALLKYQSIASMILGALAAMAQTKVKRLLAHSSIGHVGYIRTGFSCGTIEGIQSLLIGIFIYASMTIDAFAIVSALRQSLVKYIADLGALAKTNPISAITFSITMFSYAGIPPLAGFCSKFYLFFAALGCGAYFLAPVGVVTSVIGRWAAERLPREDLKGIMTLRFPRFSQGLAQHPTTRRIWFGIATTHDFESHDDITEERLYRNIFASYFGQLAIIFLCTSGNLFHVAWQGNFESWVQDPLHVRPIAHAIWDPYFCQPAIEAFTRGGALRPVNIAYSSVYQWWLVTPTTGMETECFVV
nr:NADH-ubiquinone oxidoreductase chain 2 [Tanacetum cinerariifolium]